MHSYQPERRTQPNHVFTALRRFRGLAADELFLLCRPCDAKQDAARQAAAVYEAMLGMLVSEGIGPDALVTETLFFRSIRDDAETVRGARSRALMQAGFGPSAPATTFIGQSPLAAAARFELAAVAIVPHGRDAWSSQEVSTRLACPCEACVSGLSARVVRVGDRIGLHAGNIYGSGRDPFEEAYDMFAVTERLLAEAGMGFGDVIRTWIHLRDIDRDYDALNRARREFFRRCGLERRPASTGVQGAPLPAEHDFSMTVYAAKSSRSLDVASMSAPTLNEAWTYGADFSRGLRVAGAGEVTLHISGTASIDEAGRSVHAGDFAGQVDRMLVNIESLLAAEGASFADLVSGVTYLKNAADAPLLNDMFRARGFDGFPCALVEAPLCRPELLCETEAVAILPRARRA